jgi:hypothetical protein
MVAHTLDMDAGRLRMVGIDGLRQEINRTARAVFNRSQVLCPVDTGNLRASGRRTPVVVVGNYVKTEIIYDAEYAAAVHNGRRALTIRAKGNGRLKFVVDGRTVYARQVHQPARAGRPFLAQALREIAGGRGYGVTIG